MKKTTLAILLALALTAISTAVSSAEVQNKSAVVIKNKNNVTVKVVKVFEFDYEMKAPDTERTVNQWIRDNPNILITEQSVVRTSPSGYVVVIWYTPM